MFRGDVKLTMMSKTEVEREEKGSRRWTRGRVVVELL